MSDEYLSQPNLLDELETKFQTYHRENPQIYAYFKRFTFEKINQGATHLGSSAVFERIRWESPATATTDEFKINNTYQPFYSRMFMKDYPEYEGFFRLRTAKADEEIEPFKGEA